MRRQCFWLFLFLAASSARAAAPVRTFPTYDSLTAKPFLAGTQFGMVGNGTTDNRAALQAAVSAVVASSQELYLPPGTYPVNLTTLNPKISVAGNLKLTGAGRGKTIIRVGSLPPADTALFEGTTAETVELADLTLQGPASAGATAPNPAPFHAYGLHLTSGVGGTGKCALTRVDFAGQFTEPVFADAGVSGITHALTAQDCDVTGYSAGITCLAEAATTTRSLKVLGCAIHDLANLGGATGRDVGFGPNVAVDVDSCRFVNNPLLSVGPVGTATVAALHSRFADDTWLAGCANALALPVNGPSEARGGWFYNAGIGITLGSDTLLSDCWFRSLAVGSQATTAAGVTGAHIHRLENCHVESQMHLTCDGTGQNWLVSNCEIDPNGSGTGATGVVIGGTATVWLNQVRVNNLGQAAGSVGVTVGAGTTLRMRGCAVSGGLNGWDSGLGGVVIASGAADALIENGEFVGSGTSTAILAPNTGTDSGILTTRSITYSGCRPQSPGTSWQRGRLVAGFGAVLTAAATLPAGTDGDTFHVGGTTPITSLVLLNDAATQRCFDGATVTLIADAGWSTLGGGNLLPRTTGVRTVNSVSVWLYDATAGTWTEE